MKEHLQSLTSKRSLIAMGSVGLLSLLGAFTVSMSVERMLALPDGAEVADQARIESDSSSPVSASVSPRSSSASISRGKRFYVNPILERNIFDPDAVRSEPITEEEGERSDLPYKVLATTVSSPSIYSTAILAGERGDDALVYSLAACPNGATSTKGIPCSAITDDAEIIGIEWRCIRIRRGDGTIEYLDMGGDDAPVRQTAAAATTDPTDGIQANGEDHYTVDRSLIDNALDDLDSLANQVRVRRHRDSDGEVDGFRLSGIRRGSMLSELGIKNGDIVHEVNGYPLTSNSGAMTAFQSLQSEANFTFDITRRNRRKQMTYEVR